MIPTAVDLDGIMQMGFRMDEYQARKQGSKEARSLGIHDGRKATSGDHRV